MRKTSSAVIFLLLTSGCGLVLDTVYLAGDGKKEVTHTRNEPTTEKVRHKEHRIVSTMQGVHISCEQVTSAVLRSWTDYETYKYRRGFPRQYYWAAAGVAALYGLIYGSITFSKCSDGTSRACDARIGLIGFGIDAAYSLVRSLTVAEPVLIERASSRAKLTRSTAALQSENIICPKDLRLRMTAAGSAEQLFSVMPDGSLRAEDHEMLVQQASGRKDVWLELDGPWGTDRIVPCHQIHAHRRPQQACLRRHAHQDPASLPIRGD